MTSSSFALSFFSLLRGVATPALLAALCRLLAAALGGGGDLPRSLSLTGCFKGSSVEEDAGDDLADLFGYPDGGVVEGAGGRRSLAVFDRPNDCDRGFEGSRCDVERSRAGVAAEGGAGAGRYAEGATTGDFFGGGGGARYGE
jgi:hypothetical protein